ncbi:MAG: PKD domain-containing protein [Candidatus Thermoplasmatota archaeon]|nr:PKD domain-containing protein [Candidatus Thermoplasmatota archaeon]
MNAFIDKKKKNRNKFIGHKIISFCMKKEHIIVLVTLFVLITVVVSPFVSSKSDNPCSRGDCHTDPVYYEYLEIATPYIPSEIAGNTTVNVTIKITSPDDWLSYKEYYKCTSVSAELKSEKGYVTIKNPIQYSQSSMYPEDEWYVEWNVSAEVSGDDTLEIKTRAYNPHKSSTMYDAYSVDVIVTVSVIQGNQKPAATIISITPTVAEQGQEITFKGDSIDTDGYIIEYSWHSDIDGSLSNEQNFTSSSLSAGKHTIYFRVKDNNGTWSNNAEKKIYVYKKEESKTFQFDVNELWKQGRITGFIALFLLLGIIISCLMTGKNRCPRCMFRIHYFMFFAIFLIGVYHCAVLYIGPYAGSTKGLVSGSLSATLMLFAGISCIFRKPINRCTRHWRKFHLWLAIITFIVSLVHAILVGTTFAFLR